MTKEEQILNLIENYGGIDGNHHKQWILDQIVRILVDDYEGWVWKYERDVDGIQVYEWDRGIAP